MSNNRQFFQLDARGCPDLADRSRVFQQAYESKPIAFDIAANQCASFIKENAEVRVSVSPRTNFAREQALSTVNELVYALKRKCLSYIRSRELIVNLAEFCESNNVNSCTTSATAGFLVTILTAMGEVFSAIETVSKQQVTNWSNVANFYKELVRTNDETKLNLPLTSFFRTDRFLGEGGFGVVAKCRFANTTDVCCKIIPINRMKNPKYICTEKVTASVINYLLLVRYFCCFETDGAFVTVMEYGRGVDLWRVSHQSSCSIKHRRFIMAQLGLATMYLHLKGLTHRDIKPCNILMLDGCIIRMIDFDTVKIGLGKFSHRIFRLYYSRTYCEFVDRETAGTMNYHPPECFKNKAYGRSIDWWAVGISLYELITGKAPFKSKDEKELEDMILKDDVKFPSDVTVDEREKHLVLRLLDKETKTRLCSGDYSEYMDEKYFSEIDWKAVEGGKIKLEWQHWPLFMKSNGLTSPKAVELYDETKDKVHKIEDVKDVTESTPLYTFVSPAFEKAVIKLKENKRISASDLFDVPESLQGSKILDYKFKTFF